MQDPNQGPEEDEPGHRWLDHTWTTWVHLEPAERLRRSLALRDRLVNPQAAHDAKLFPKP